MNAHQMNEIANRVEDRLNLKPYSATVGVPLDDRDGWVEVKIKVHSLEEANRIADALPSLGFGMPMIVHPTEYNRGWVYVIRGTAFPS